jgi:hypothetical protein
MNTEAITWNDVKEKPFPIKEVGAYLVQLDDKYTNSYIHGAIVMSCANGFATTIGGHFLSDIVECGIHIVAWCQQPKGIVFREDLPKGVYPYD